MYAKIGCLAKFRLQELSKYLKSKGFLCLPCFYDSMTLYIIVKNINKTLLLKEIKNFEEL